MPWTGCCRDSPPPPLQGWGPCPPLEIGDVTIGDITADVDLTEVVDKLCEISDTLNDLDLNVEIGDLDVEVPVLVPCPGGCVAVDGIVDPAAFPLMTGDELTWYTIVDNTPTVITGTVEVLDACDDRCLPTCCDGNLPGFDCPAAGCDCNCDETDLAAAATAIGGITG